MEVLNRALKCGVYLFKCASVFFLYDQLILDGQCLYIFLNNFSILSHHLNFPPHTAVH